MNDTVRTPRNTLPTRRCLITGATGFIGGRLGRALAMRGWDVTALARATSDRSALDGAKVRWIVGDVTNPAGLAEAVRGRDVVFHCAGLTKALDVAALNRVNGEGTRNLLEACAAASPPPGRIIVLSSQAAAGPSLPDGRPRAESDPAEPVSDYGRSKRAGEEWVERLRERLPIVLLRPSAVYGPSERDFFTLFQAVRKSGLLVEAGLHPLLFQAIYGDDLVEAMRLAAETEAGRVVGRTFFLAHPRPWASDDFGREIGRAVGRERIRVVRIPLAVAHIAAGVSEAVARLRGKPTIVSRDKLRELACGSWTCRTDAFREAVGFDPPHDAPEGLRLTAQWYRDTGWL